MPLSQRYLPHLIALLVLALIPVTLHTYAEVRGDECADPLVLVSSSSIVANTRRNKAMSHRFSGAQFREGRLPGRDGEPPLSIAVIRGYDAKKLYYRISNRVHDAAPDRVELEWLEGEPRLPIRRASFKPDPIRSTVLESAYLLIYDGEPVENPYRNQLLAAPRRLFTGNRPMTAFFVSATVPAASLEAIRRRQDEWLRESWERYRAVCFP